MSEVLSPPAEDGRDKRGNVNNQSPHNQDLPHPEAFGVRFGAPPDEGAVQGEVQGADADAERPAAIIDLARLTARDRAAIQTTVLLRLLTYDQLHHLAFPTVED